MSLERNVPRESETVKGPDKNKALALAFTAFLSACGENMQNLANSDTVQNYLKEHPDAEQIEKGKIKTMHEILTKFKQVAEKRGSELDLSQQGAIGQPNENLHINKAELINESTIKITRVPRKQYGYSISDLSYETLYSFGPEKMRIEMGNNLVPSRFSRIATPILATVTSSPNISIMIDNKTGGIVAFYQSESFGDNSFRLSKDAGMEVGASYTPTSATNIARDAIKHFKEISDAVRE